MNKTTIKSVVRGDIVLDETNQVFVVDFGRRTTLSNLIEILPQSTFQRALPIVSYHRDTEVTILGHLEFKN